jgi:hypothetical protein
MRQTRTKLDRLRWVGVINRLNHNKKIWAGFGWFGLNETDQTAVRHITYNNFRSA